MDSVTITQGVRDVKYPPELALGNIVRLKEPYRPDGKRGREYVFGIIVEQQGSNAFGHLMVSLHVYDRDGNLYPGCNGIPTYLDCAADELLLYKVASETGYAVLHRDGTRGGTFTMRKSPPEGLDPVPDERLGWDLHPPCSRGCDRKSSHPFGANATCPACRGWGYERVLRPVPPGG
jgi:hypothetical protein